MATFPSTGVLDDFNRADAGPPPSASWTTDPYGAALPGHTVTANAMKANGANASSYWNTQFGADQEAYFTYSTWASAGNATDVYARLQTPGSAAVDGYSVTADFNASTVTIFRLDNSTTFQLGATISNAMADGDSLGINCVGNIIQAWHKPSAGSWTLIGYATDATYNLAGYVGIYNALASSVMDNFGGGNSLNTFGMVRRSQT